MVFTTSYKSKASLEFLTALTRLIHPLYAVEIGVQQAASAIAIARGMQPDALFMGYDLFEKSYSAPPYASTHADIHIARQNMVDAELLCNWSIEQGSSQDVYLEPIHLLHIDICNHYQNIYEVLLPLLSKVDGVVLLEGGPINHWQVKYNFRPFLPLLDEDPIAATWSHTVLRFENQGAMTLMTRRG